LGSAAGAGWGWEKRQSADCAGGSGGLLRGMIILEWLPKGLASTNGSSDNSIMWIELERLESAIGDFDLQADDDQVDPTRLTAAIDRLQGKLCRVLNRGRERGQHQLAGL